MTSIVTQPPNPEVPEKAIRRRFTPEYKLSILRQAEASQAPIIKVRRNYWHTSTGFCLPNG